MSTVENPSPAFKENNDPEDGWDDEGDDEEDDRGNVVEVADARTGTVRVLSRKCDTCVFHPGNRMHLAEGRLRELLREIMRRRGHLVCHSTLPGMAVEPTNGAICRGSADRYASQSLAMIVGNAAGMIEYTDPPLTHLKGDA